MFITRDRHNVRHATSRRRRKYKDIHVDPTLSLSLAISLPDVWPVVGVGWWGVWSVVIVIQALKELDRD